MKKWKRILAVILCMLCIQTPMIPAAGPVQVQAATVKSGLNKENGKYYYYVKGQKVKNTWKSVTSTVNGKKVTYRYYFGSNGAAYAGQIVNGVSKPVIKKISRYYYAFDAYGRMLTGTYPINSVYRTFASNGRMIGYIKINGVPYYYTGAKKAVNTFKTVKMQVGNKICSYRYYFGANGAAVRGKVNALGEMVPAVRKINGSYYGFNSTGKMITGTYVINDKFCVFSSSTGKYNASLSYKLRTASKEGADAAALRALLGSPLKTETLDSCMGDGNDELLYYSHFIVSLFKDRNGKETVLGVMSR